MNVKELKFEELLSTLESEDRKDYYDSSIQKPDSKTLEELLNNYVDGENIPSKTVLGIDIYRYSKYNELPQNLVPFLSEIILKELIRHCLNHETYIFQKYENEEIFRKNMINTGDGGFFIFDTPIHAITFAIKFESIIRAFNSFHFYPKLRNIMGTINLRYAITYDKVCRYRDNFYGAGIITNARILSKDKLNRVLIDENVYEWFLLNINGIENLMALTINDLHKINEFKQYDKTKINTTTFFPVTIKNDFYSRIGINVGINNVDVQKIGEIVAKEDKISIYNLHIQHSAMFSDEQDSNKSSKFTISLGNLNVSGISD